MQHWGLSTLREEPPSPSIFTCKYASGLTKCTVLQQLYPPSLLRYVKEEPSPVCKIGRIGQRVSLAVSVRLKRAIAVECSLFCILSKTVAVYQILDRFQQFDPNLTSFGRGKGILVCRHTS
jgi:hypothetical protein